MFSALFFVAGFILACSFADPRDHSDVDSQFIPYLMAFEEMTGVEVHNVPIAFDDPGENNAAVCWRYDQWHGDVYEIAVSPEWWFENTDTYLREALIAHELGHCVLGRLHNFDTNEDSQPISLMYPVISGIDPEYFAIHRNYYYSELAYLYKLNNQSTDSQSPGRDY